MRCLLLLILLSLMPGCACSELGIYGALPFGTGYPCGGAPTAKHTTWTLRCGKDLQCSSFYGKKICLPISHYYKSKKKRVWICPPGWFPAGVCYPPKGWKP